MYSCWNYQGACNICDMFQSIRDIIKILGVVQVGVSVCTRDHTRSVRVR